MADKKFKSASNDSPNKFVTNEIIGAGLSLAGGIMGAISAGKQKREAERKERKARQEMQRRKELYSQIDVSNPFANLTNRFEGLQNQYAGMENTMEDLTVNQKQAQFEREQNQMNQANIMAGLRGAAGGSGIGALAPSVAQQGQISAQRSAASIGQQESANQRAAATQAGRIQEMEARGASQVDIQRAQGAAQADALRGQGQQWSAQQQLAKEGTLLGMAQGEVAAYQQQAQAANQAKWGAITSGVQNAMSFIPGLELPGTTEE